MANISAAASALSKLLLRPPTHIPKSLKDTAQTLFQIRPRPCNPRLITVCGPSGSGKSSFVRHLKDLLPSSHIVPSYTTRKQRESENEDSSSIFISQEEFENMKEEFRFVFHAGSLESPVYYGRKKNDILKDKLNICDVSTLENRRLYIPKLKFDSACYNGTIEGLDFGKRIKIVFNFEKSYFFLRETKNKIFSTHKIYKIWQPSDETGRLPFFHISGNRFSFRGYINGPQIWGTVKDKHSEESTQIGEFNCFAQDYAPIPIFTLFLRPERLDELVPRLRERGMDEDEIRYRMNAAMKNIQNVEEWKNCGLIDEIVIAKEGQFKKIAKTVSEQIMKKMQKQRFQVHPCKLEVEYPEGWN